MASVAVVESLGAALSAIVSGSFGSARTDGALVVDGELLRELVAVVGLELSPALSRHPLAKNSAAVAVGATKFLPNH